MSVIILRWVALLSAVFVSLYLIAGRRDGGPGGPIFAFVALFVLSSFSGWTVERYFSGTGGSWQKNLRLPPLLGMLIMGLLCRNLPDPIGNNLGSKIRPQLSATVRSLALTLILTRAGLSLDLQVIWRLRDTVARLASLPLLCETITVAALAMWWLQFASLSWALMLGFVVAAVSPAVVIPTLLKLREDGASTSAGSRLSVIVPVLIASAALDDVLAIAGFGICLGFATSSSDSSSSWFVYAKVPMEVFLGVGVGVIGGSLVAFLSRTSSVSSMAIKEEPSGLSTKHSALSKSASESQQTLNHWRVGLLLVFACLVFFSLKKAGFSGAAALAVLILAATAVNGFQLMNLVMIKGWTLDDAKPIATLLASIWTLVAQPLLFVLVGAAVSVKTLEARIIGVGVVILVIGVSVRSFVVVFGALGGCCSSVIAPENLSARNEQETSSDKAPMAKKSSALAAESMNPDTNQSISHFTWGERLFVAIAWTPKATVQAAIGGIALDEANPDNEEEQRMGRDILNLAVLAILCTAPCGAALILGMWPRLLGVISSAPVEKVEEDLVDGIENHIVVPVQSHNETGGSSEQDCEQHRGKKFVRIASPRKSKRSPKGRSPRGGSRSPRNQTNV